MRGLFTSCLLSAKNYSQTEQIPKTPDGLKDHGLQVTEIRFVGDPQRIWDQLHFLSWEFETGNQEFLSILVGLELG